MEVTEDFGIVIACHKLDYFLAKGCCASVRYFFGNLPICLLLDGQFSTRDLQESYGVQILDRTAVSETLLKESSFGYGLTKMIAFWESPWRHFLYLDADAIVWGDVLRYRNFRQFDMVIDKPRFRYSDDFINSNFFDVAGVERHFPDFAWRAFRDFYFVTGTFFGTRGIFELDEYAELLRLNKLEKLFHYGEMGLLNFLICRSISRSGLRVNSEPMQLLVPDFNQNDLRYRFPIVRGVPCPKNESVVIHWCGTKPTFLSPKLYSNAMIFARSRFLEDSKELPGLVISARLKFEDAQYHARRLLGS